MSINTLLNKILEISIIFYSSSYHHDKAEGQEALILNNDFFPEAKVTFPYFVM